MGNPLSKYCLEDTTVSERERERDVNSSSVSSRVPTSTDDTSATDLLRGIFGGGREQGSVEQGIKDLSLESKLEKRDIEILKKYEILTADIKKLSIGVEGGMGIIHIAEWKGRKVAIKETDISVILREVDVYSRMKGTNYVVEFYGIAYIPYLPKPSLCLVTNYAEKGSLTWHLKVEYHKLNWSDKLRLATQISSGLQYLHQVGVYHRDLHGGNILIDNTGNATLTDFGASTVMQERVERNMKVYSIEQDPERGGGGESSPEFRSQVSGPEVALSQKSKKTDSSKSGNSDDYDPLIGIMAYIAPERFRDPSKFDKQCDIYSLGVLLWELTSGHPAFAKVPQDVQLAVAILNGKRELPVEGTPLAYIELYERCWDTDPAKRPSTNEIVQTLKKIRASMTKAQLNVTRKRTKTKYSSLEVYEQTKSIPRPTSNIQQYLFLSKKQISASNEAKLE